jgi:uncharacterized protein YraI
MKIDRLSARRARRGRHLIIATLAAALWVPSAAQAQILTAITTTTFALRAGPAANYPHVFLLERGTPVAVHSCRPEWNWCEVSYGNVRGWLPGGYLTTAYQGTNVPIPDLGARLGVAIIPFSFDDHRAHRPHHHRPRRPPTQPPILPGSGPDTPPHGSHGPCNR